MKDDRPPPDPKAARRKAAQAALKAYHRDESIFERLEPAIEVLKVESDRGAILLVGGLLDDLLGYRIVSALPDKSQAEKLLNHGGVLGWFQDRMTMALAMGVIDQETFDQIEMLRLLRNKCAHTIGPVSLSVPVFSDMLGLIVDDEIADSLRGEGVTAETRRGVLTLAMVYLVERIMGKSKDEAETVVTSMVDGTFQRSDSSPEKRPKRSARADRPDRSDKKS